MSDGSRQPRVVIPAKRSSSSAAEPGNSMSQTGNPSKRAKQAKRGHRPAAPLDRSDQEEAAVEENDAPPPFELEHIIEDRAEASTITLTISIRAAETDRRGKTTYEDFETDTVEGKVELASYLQVAVDSLVRDAMTQAHPGAQGYESEEDILAISSASEDVDEVDDDSERLDNAEPGERQLRRNEYHPNAPMTEVSK
jgi:hypothetical protein